MGLGRTYRHCYGVGHLHHMTLMFKLLIAILLGHVCDLSNMKDSCKVYRHQLQTQLCKAVNIRFHH